MRVLLTNDWHVASDGPSTRRDAYHPMLARKLAWIEAQAKESHVDAIAIAGDVFDRTTIAFRLGDQAPLTALTDTLTRWSRRWPLLVIPGNHDLPHNRLDLLPGTPFGVLLAAGILTPVWERPWVHKSGHWVGGVPYPVTRSEVVQWASRAPQAPGVLMLHAFGGLARGDMFGDPIYGYADLGAWVPQAVVFHFGHEHKDMGVHTLGMQHFVQIGALIRGTLAEDQVTRHPKVVVVDTLEARPLVEAPATATYQVYDVPIEPFAEVFDLELRQKVVEVDQTIDAYVQELAAVSAPANVPAADLVDALDVPAPVRRLVKHYLQAAVRGDS